MRSFVDVGSGTKASKISRQRMKRYVTVKVGTMNSYLEENIFQYDLYFWKVYKFNIMRVTSVILFLKITYTIFL